MKHNTYSYLRSTPTRYFFISIGKRRIVKVVDFIPTARKNIVNMGFGDLQPDGSINDSISSNNGDLIKVLSTVIDIFRDFTIKNPDIEIFFIGSTAERTRLYGRILKTHYEEFRKNYIISIIAKSRNGFERIDFDPNVSIEYLGFLIKRIN